MKKNWLNLNWQKKGCGGCFPGGGEPHTLHSAGVAVGSPPGKGTPRLHNPPDTAPSPIVPPICYDQLATLLRLAYFRLKLLAQLHKKLPPERISREITSRRDLIASCEPGYEQPGIPPNLTLICWSPPNLKIFKFFFHFDFDFWSYQFHNNNNNMY